MKVVHGVKRGNFWWLESVNENGAKPDNVYTVAPTRIPADSVILIQARSKDGVSRTGDLTGQWR